MQLKCLRFLLAGLCTLTYCGFATVPALALDYSQPFYPDFMQKLPRAEEQHHKLPFGLLNINQADLNQLMAIPTMTENMALKIIRYRPFRQASDLNRLSALPIRERERLIRITSTRLQFKDAPSASSGSILRQ
jgi:Helix-hairpin-helix motif